MTNLSLANKETNVTSIPLNYISDYYGAFLSTKSPNTVAGYRTDIGQFCKTVFDKKVEFVTMEDIKSTTSIHASRFHEYLSKEANKGKGFKNSTIKRKINAVRSFYRYMRVDNSEINVYVFDNIDLKSEDIDSNRWGTFKWEEAIEMWDYALENQIEGNQMGMLIKLGAITSIRLDALLNLEWGKNFFVDDRKGFSVNYIDVVDKSQRHIVPISDDFYDELKGNLLEEKLFPNLHAHKVGRNLREIIKAFNYDVTRNLVFHSLKKAGVNRVLMLTNSLKMAKQQGNHKSIATTEKHYAETQEDLTLMASYTLDKSVNAVEEIELFSKEDILSALGKISDGAQFELLRALKLM